MPETENATTREKVFFAAVRLFAKHGYERTTVRDICREAGTSNATAVNYYFDSKMKLYKSILNLMFADSLRRKKEQEETHPSSGLTAEQRLRRFLSIMVEVGFSNHPLAKDITAIIFREMMAPSKFLDDLVARFARQDNDELYAIIHEILGEHAPEAVVRDSLASVISQVYYYLAFWPIFIRVYPDHPGIDNYREQLVDHVTRFSLAGLKATGKALERGEIPRQP